MPATTVETWKVNGVTLNQHCWNISTLTGRNRTPPKRGSNQQVAYRDGAIWVPKWADQQTITLAMWIIGTDENGYVSDDVRALFNEHWHELARLFWTEHQLLTVEKSWLTPAGLVTATAQAEVASSIDLTADTVGRGVMSVDLVIPDVWFWGPLQQVEIPRNTPVVVNNPGDATLRWMTINFENTLVNPTLTNASTDPDIWVKFGGTIGDLEYVQLDTRLFTAVKDDVDNVIGAITRSGSRNWMNLLPGNNTLTLTADSGTGTAQIFYQAPYF